ncbi:MAG: TIGR00289 family protein [Candidatus Pacearchaeota archaeon]
MRLGVLFSGGKDSTFAMYKLIKHNKIACLISIVSKNPESFMFHTPNIHLVELQAKALGIPLILKETQGKKERELKDLKNAIIEAQEKYKIDGIVTGAVASKYQKERIEKICNELKLKCISPLWLKEQIELLNEIIDSGFNIIISGVFAYPLDEKWLGKEIDREIIDKLAKLQDRYKLNPSGEGGEIETTVLNCPMFKKKIEIIESEIKFKGNSGVYLIKKARLIEK